MRVLYGLYPPDEGRIQVRAAGAHRLSRDAIGHGIGMVHQHFVLVDRFTVAENIVLGAEGGPVLDLDGAGERIRTSRRTTASTSASTRSWRACPSGRSSGSRS